MTHPLGKSLAGLLVALLPLLAVALLGGDQDPRTGVAAAASLAGIERERPAVVFIGNSMVRRGVSAEILTEASGAKTYLLAKPGAFSALWYLFIKNVLVPARHRPGTVVIVFRDDYLTRPTYRVDGLYKKEIDAYATAAEPALDRLAYGAVAEDGLMSGLAGVERSRRWMKERAESRALTLYLDIKERNLKRMLGRTFGEGAMVGELVDLAQLDAEELDEERLVDFDAAVSDSFLPLIIELAADHDMQLVMVRYKRKRDLGGNNEPPELKRYIGKLRAYLERHSVPLIDFTDDPRITLEHWGRGDHLDPDMGKPVFSRILAEELRPWIGSAGE